MSGTAGNGVGRLTYLDGLRGLAILGVVAFHATGTAGPAFAQVVGRIGAHGVDFFFALSGYCLSRRAFAGDAEPATVRSHVRFVLVRFARVAPAYYVALAGFAALSFTAFGFPSVANAPHVGSAAAWWEAVRDAMFLTSAAPSYDASFWTLGIEMRWYLLCPLLIALYVRSRMAFALLPVALYGLYATPWSLADAGCLPAFMLGIVAAARAGKRGPLERAAPSLALVTVAAACMRQAFDPNVDHGDPLWHVACYFVLTAAAEGPLHLAFSWRPLRALGIASYSIYLVHQPILVWLATHGRTRLTAATVSVVAGVCFWFLVERPLGGAFRARLQTTLLAGAERIADAIVVARSRRVARTTIA